MFCNQCGTELRPDYNLCPKCGTPVGKLAPLLPVPGRTRLERHLPTLGILWIVAGAIFLIPSFALLTLGSVAHIEIPGAQDVMRMLGPPLLFMIGATLLLVAAGGICVGWGLMQRQPWARTAALILGFLALIHPPFGTALGVYTIWVLLANNAGSDYDQMAKAGN